MRLVVASCLLAISSFAFAQNSQSPRAALHPALKTYTNPDGSFRFAYPDLLIECEKRQQPGGYTWVQKECSAYFPTCDEGIGLNQNQKTVACFAYPRNDHSDSDTFEAATFSVARAMTLPMKKDACHPH